MKRQPLDNYDIVPDDMRAYLRHNGYHFNKKMCEFACRHLYKNGKRIDCWSKDDVQNILKRASVDIQETDNYDFVYVANMAKADFYNSSITDDAQLALFVKDYVEDSDQTDGFIFHRFYADCCWNGVRIPWEDVV